MTSILIKSIFGYLINFYTLSFQNVGGSTINMSAFEGKKVFITTIATGSDKVGQLAALQQLQHQYHDSLIIIAFPSNSFGNETRSNSEIKQFCQSTYGATFLIASKVSVSGQNVHEVFRWLAQKSKNGEMDAPVGGDFQKFLIDKDGMLIGVYSPKVSPMDPKIIQAITTVL